MADPTTIQVDINDLVVPGGRTSARGRTAKPLAAVVTRELTQEDIISLSEPRGPTTKEDLNELKARHHRAAQYFALGFKNLEVSIATGYSEPYLSTLQNTPAFQQLVTFYQTREEDKFDQVREQLGLLGDMAREEMLKRLENDPDSLEMKDLRALHADALDRLGYSKITKNLNLNASIPPAELAEMKRAINQSQNVQKISHNPRPQESREAFTESLDEPAEGQGGKEKGPSV